jgi:hypothetical protein
MIDELKPCPFCGYDAEHIHVCINEGCPVRPSVTRADEQEAFALWNQRVAHPTPDDSLLAALRILKEKLEFESDEGPCGEGWRSKELLGAWEVINAALDRAMQSSPDGDNK